MCIFASHAALTIPGVKVEAKKSPFYGDGATSNTKTKNR